MQGLDTDRDVDAQAAAWFARVRGIGRARAEEEGLAAWLERPAHRRAYSRIAQMWSASGALADDPDIRRVTASALQPRAATRGALRRWWAPALGAAAFAAAVLVWRPQWGAPEVPSAFAQSYRTQSRPSERIGLPDGSVLRLNVQSQVTVNYGQDERTLVLEAGEAVFEVQRDSERPFVVRAGNMLVRALGTRFSVRKDPNRIGVALLEGKVDVRSDDTDKQLLAALSPGQYFEMTTLGEPTLRTINPSTVVAWTEGKLIFEAVPVATAVAEFNRYAPGQIPPDLARADMPITGVFDIDDPASFVAALEAMLPATKPSSEGTRPIDRR
jgi:transmembrane sensor